LLELGRRTDSNLAEMGAVFTFRSVGYLIGAIGGGVLFDKETNPARLITAATISVALGVLFVPMQSSVVALGVVVSLQGLGMGVLDTGGNVLLIKIWGQAVGPRMQLMHCLFGVGAFVSPLIAGSYIGEWSANSTRMTHRINSSVNWNNNINAGTDGTAWNGTNTEAGTHAANDTNLLPGSGGGGGGVEWAFYIAAAMLVPFIGLWVHLACSVPACGEFAPFTLPAESTSIAAHHANYRNHVVLCGMLFLGVYVGCEVAYGGLVATFAIGSLGQCSFILLTSAVFKMLDMVGCHRCNRKAIGCWPHSGGVTPTMMTSHHRGNRNAIGCWHVPFRLVGTARNTATPQGFPPLMQQAAF
jgi:FHS family Na+ dependent glucose MFS transporter 1